MDRTITVLTLDLPPKLAERLPSLEPCSNTDLLSKRGFIPENADQRRDGEELLPVLERAGILAWMDRDADARRVIEPFADRLGSSTHPRVRALHEELLGRVTRGQAAE